MWDPPTAKAHVHVGYHHCNKYHFNYITSKKTQPIKPQYSLHLQYRRTQFERTSTQTNHNILSIYKNNEHLFNLPERQAYMFC